jgi:hypothetical protein
LVLVFGGLADVVNVGISAARGNYGDAALSAAAIIPFAGWGTTAAKWGLQHGDDALAFLKNSDEALAALGVCAQQLQRRHAGRHALPREAWSPARLCSQLLLADRLVLLHNRAVIAAQGADTSSRWHEPVSLYHCCLAVDLPASVHRWCAMSLHATRRAAAVKMNHFSTRRAVHASLRRSQK